MVSINKAVYTALVAPSKPRKKNACQPTDARTNGPTDEQTLFRAARTHLKRRNKEKTKRNEVKKEREKKERINGKKEIRMRKLGHFWP